MPTAPLRACSDGRVSRSQRANRRSASRSLSPVVPFRGSGQFALAVQYDAHVHVVDNDALKLLKTTFILIALVAAGCGSDGGGSEEPASSTPTSADELGSLDIDPGDGSLLIGSSVGTFKLPAGATKVEPVEPEMSADGKQGPLNDLVVRFTGPGAVIASGHSRGGTLPQNAGLMRSADAETWESISGLGEIDYHDIEVLNDQDVVALRVDQPDIQVSDDGGKTFEGRAAPAVARAVDVTINPNDAKQWAVGTEQGTFLSTNQGGSWRQRDTTFGARVSWAPDALYSAGLDGKVRKSSDGGKEWHEVGTVGAGPKDFVATGGGKLYAYVPGGKIRSSQDGGATWTDLASLF